MKEKGGKKEKTLQRTRSSGSLEIQIMKQALEIRHNSLII
jgi:hypothetical protein